MKNCFKTLALTALVLLVSCSKDENESGSNENDQAIEELENTPLQAEEVANNVVIQGGTKSDGAPPTPNEAISLDVSGSSEVALLGEGFEVSINSDASITGAYLQFKSNDDAGVVADSYYDIDLNANNSNKKAVSFKGFKKKANRLSAKVEDTTLDVDFNTNIEPGTFCYVICVYDAEGNISAPQEVCVTVESWGGNSKAVGAWKLVEQEYTEDGETVKLALGQEDCEDYIISCQEGGQVEVTECFTTVDLMLTINENGTYNLISNSEDDIIDYNATQEQCQQVTIEGNKFTYQSQGNWAYVSDEERLTLVEYSYSETDGGETFEETYEAGNGELLFDGKAEINGNTMRIVEEEDYDDDGVVDYVYRIVLQK
ncbi:hypothetical protein [uncultured Croceitalea sp.]|uniref:hypothetical protein n=1 Tax=uncultured Croceitalea sp. TaxID=1798908 RepID=UPI003305C723